MKSAYEDQVREESLWFGDVNRPIFGRLTTPAGVVARGGVLLAPPIGRELRNSRRALRTLALHLATDGFISLRFDHYGSGNSSGSMTDSEFDTTLLETVEHGVEILRSLGNIPISAVGMRMGATIVGTAAAMFDLGLMSFVMWDPCETGRSYTRELSALGALGPDIISTDIGESSKMLEYPLSDEAINRLSKFSLRLRSERPLAKRVFVVVRDDRPVSAKFRDLWESEGVDWALTSEQGSLLEGQLPASVQPQSTIANIRAWLTTPATSPMPFTVPPCPRDALVTGKSNASPVRESVIDLGDRRMFGVLSEPVGEVRGPLMVMVNGVNEDHMGPARLWVDLTRQWAGMGLRSIRFDLAQLGESPWFPGQPDRPIFDKTRSSDITDAVHSLLPTNPSNSVLVGYCSGAQLALEVAEQLGPVGVCVINPEVGAGIFRNVDRIRNSSQESVQTYVQRIDRILKRHRRADKILRWASQMVRSLAFPPKVKSALIESHSKVLILLSAEDVPRFQHLPILGRRLVSSERINVTVVPGMDHSMLSTFGRASAVDILNQYVTNNFVRDAEFLHSDETNGF